MLLPNGQPVQIANAPGAMSAAPYYPAGSVPLTSPSFPGVTVMSNDCIAAQCGVQATDQTKQICSENGYAGVKAGCSDPSCFDWRDVLGCSTMPTPTTMTMPSMTQTAQAMATVPQAPTLTPQSLQRPMPSIVNTAPVNVAPCPAGDWISQSPLLALAVLVGLAFAVIPSSAHHRRG